jgi:P27 family predicted phage terminase small subunit
MGILTTIDRDALARYCVLMSQWIEAAEYIAAHGPVCEEPYATDGGMGVRYTDHPAVARMLRLDAQLQRLGSRFCMTAGDRAGMAAVVTGKPQSHEDELAAKYGG